MKQTNFSGMSERDVSRAVTHFQHAFREKTRHLYTGKCAKKGTELYQLQVDFSYLLHSLQTTFKHNRPRELAQLNDFMERIPQSISK